MYQRGNTSVAVIRRTDRMAKRKRTKDNDPQHTTQKTVLLVEETGVT